jgi:hypothetical protein
MKLKNIVDWDNDVLAAWRRSAQHTTHHNNDVWSRLPAGVCWFQAEIEAQDIDAMYVIGSEDWKEVFGTYRLLGVACANYEIDDHYHHRSRIDSVQKTLIANCKTEPLIMVGSHGAGPFVVMDGNHRATAMLRLNRLVGQECYVGFQQKIATDFVWFRRAVK